MSLLSDDELAELQEIAADIVCDLDCTIERKSTPTKTPSGTPSGAYAVISPSDQKCGLGPPTASQLQAYQDRLGTQTLHQVRFPVGTNVQAQDRVTVNGQRVIVQGVERPRSYPALIFALATGVS